LLSYKGTLIKERLKTMSKWNYGVDKTYSTASEAFRDADYATGLWKCETDKDKAIRYIKDGSIFFLLGGAFLAVTTIITRFTH